MPSIVPSIDRSIADLAPGFRAISIGVEATGIANPDVAAKLLDHACHASKTKPAPWAAAHLTAWADVFRRFGAKPQRTPCSAESLYKRVLRDGILPSIDPIVDLYNAISIQYAVPVGGENFSAYVGTPLLTIANGSEPFDTMKDGVLVLEFPEPGEVIWCDSQGVTCRRWNWRQGVRTRLSSEDKKMWFILESLPAMPLNSLQEAGEKLIEGLQLMMPGSNVEQDMIDLASH